MKSLNSMKAIYICFLCATLAGSLSSCQSLHDLGVPNAQFDAIRFEQAEISVADQEGSLDVVLAFKVDNPTATRLWIPRHTFAMRLGLEGQTEEQMTVVQTGTRSRVSVSPRAETTVEYTVPLSLSSSSANQLASYLGHEAVYQFDATVDLGALNPSGNPPRLRHRGTLKLPLPPQIALNGTPRFSFVGQLEEIDLTETQSKMAGVVGAINQLGPGTLPGVGPHWNQFMNAYNSLNTVVSYPGPNTDGVNIRVPMRVRNPNHFPIELPAFSSSVGLANASEPVVDLTLRPSTGNALNRNQRTIGARSTRTVSAETTVRWSELPQGFQSILQSNGLNNAVEIEGSISVDLGYGPVKVAYP